MDYVEAGEAARMLGVSHRAMRNLASWRHLEVRREGEGATACLLISLASSSNGARSAGWRVRIREVERNVVVGRAVEQRERSEA